MLKLSIGVIEYFCDSAVYSEARNPGQTDLIYKRECFHRGGAFRAKSFSQALEKPLEDGDVVGTGRSLDRGPGERSQGDCGVGEGEAEDRRHYCLDQPLNSCPL